MQRQLAHAIEEVAVMKRLPAHENIVELEGVEISHNDKGVSTVDVLMQIMKGIARSWGRRRVVLCRWAVDRCHESTVKTFLHARDPRHIYVHCERNRAPPFTRPTNSAS